jgi:SAM-dependent methyltransferase
MNVRQELESGYCVICGCYSSFRFDPTIITQKLQKAWGISDDLATAFNRKESMFCDYCGSSLRIRRLAAVLIETFSETTRKPHKSFTELLKDEEFRRLKIAEINACGGLHSYLKDHPNLYYSEWVPHAKPGEVRDGVRCEDLQCLTYPDDCFDIILTSETLEHVPNPDKAWHEIYRTLKDGGYHIFTIQLFLPNGKQFKEHRLLMVLAGMYWSQLIMEIGDEKTFLSIPILVWMSSKLSIR